MKEASEELTRKKSFRKAQNRKSTEKAANSNGSSRVSAANEWDVESNTRREIPDQQATMYCFVYRINTIALYWEEKSTLLMNEKM